MQIRPARDEDLKSLVALYNHYVIKTPITFDLKPYTVEQRRQSWFSHYRDTGRYRLIVAECDQGVVGYASSSKFATKAAYNTSVETSVYVASQYVGVGVGSQLYAALFQSLEGEDVHCAYAGITLPNEASVAIHRKFGFEQAGVFKEVGRKFGQYWSVAWYEKVLTNTKR